MNNGWRSVDQTFNAPTVPGTPSSAYQIVSALPTPTPALVGTLFYLEGTPPTPGNLYVLRTNALGQLVYTLLGGRVLSICMCSSDFTPFGVGLDSVIKTVPYNLSELPSLVSVNWNVEDIRFRVETPASAGNTSVQVAYYTGTGVWSQTGVLNAAAVTIASGSNEPTTRPAVISTPIIASGAKLRVNFTQIGTGASGFSVYVDLRETN